jgi:hypothetical protein
MRFRLIASYLGAPYQAALGPHGDEITLFAACPPPEELGFSSAAAHWRKIVLLADLDGLRRARPIASYQGAPCLVLDDQGDRLHITYLGGDPEQARELGYWEIDREVFEMVVPRTAVADLAEEHIDIPLASAAFTEVPTLTETYAEPFAEPFTEPGLQPVPLAAPVTELPPTSEFAPVTELEHVNGHQVLYQMTAWHGSPEPWRWPANGNHPAQRAARGGTDRMSIQAVFAELLDLAGIPASMYALDDEVPGAMCLMKTDDGFEVFASSAQARHEVRFFDDEEAAYFYLFGVLAAEAVRGGLLGPTPATGENVSKYLRPSNLPN